ncbi:hypothetical protein ACZ90_38435 [Streptomyces albus subsp. albus]|nr:hypothetical protein ACZ90_38435 [Streptomyces albus subsp. albus]
MGSRFDGTVTGVVPPGFAAYARILHPAGLDDVPVRWHQVAAANGRTAHSRMQWDHIVGRKRPLEQPGVWDEEPETGSLPRSLARPLAGVLARHTTTPERCWFGLWDGWGDLPADIAKTAVFTIPDRDMYLLSGPLAEVHRTSAARSPSAYGADTAEGSAVLAFQPEPSVAASPPGEAGDEAVDDPFWRSPNLWWPQDRAWCVASEIDFRSTYVGGSPECVAAVLAAAGLEAYPVAPEDPVGWDADQVNPRPRD